MALYRHSIIGELTEPEDKPQNEQEAISASGVTYGKKGKKGGKGARNTTAPGDIYHTR